MAEFIADTERSRIINVNSIVEVAIETVRVGVGNSDVTGFEVVGYLTQRDRDGSFEDEREYGKGDFIQIGCFDNPCDAAKAILKLFNVKSMNCDCLDNPIFNLAEGKYPFPLLCLGEYIPQSEFERFKTEYVDFDLDFS